MSSPVASALQAHRRMREVTSTLSVLAAAALVACTGTPGADATDPATPSASPGATATPDPTASPTVSATASSTASPTQGGPLGDAAECENEELGYEVDYPGDWWANDRIEPEEDDLTPIPACQYFAPSEVALQPNAGLPTGIAIHFEIPEEPIEPSDDEILDEDETTVDDHDARVFETEPAPQQGFVPEGSRMYRYVIELDDGRQLVATTDDILQETPLYEESKAILDAMMETLEIDD